MYIDRFKNKEKSKDSIILGIESSCDETACSIVRGGREILSSEIISSASEHIKYGGVVPEIASRIHTKAISIAVENAVKNSGLTLKDIDAVAVTYGAGLLGALLCGVSYAKALAYSLDIPLIPVNHIRGHIASAYLSDISLEPPFITVLCSGGHTAIIRVDSYSKFKILGGTLDDAVGEAFDKVARILDLEYPGGPNIDKLAKLGQNNIVFPKMLKGIGGYNFSYSGLKTAVINYVHNKEQKGEEIIKADVACSFQHSALDILIDKGIEAVREFNINTITAGGGVSANSYFRETLQNKCAKNNIKAILPPKILCTDNASMIASEGFIQYFFNNNIAGLGLNAVASIPLV